MVIYEFDRFTPAVHERAFMHPQVVVRRIVELGAEWCRNTLRECEPLREPRAEERVSQAGYATWKQTKKR